jgi:hypothetical protein
MTTISTLARSLATDGRFSVDDAKTLVTEAAKTNAAADVKALLKDPQILDVMEPGAKESLVRFLSIQAPPQGALGTFPDGAKVFVKDGVFVATPDAVLPTDGPAFGASVYYASRLFAEPGASPAKTMSLPEKEAVVERMLVGLLQCKAPGTPPGYEAQSQAAQQRSASATVLREIMGSLKGATGQGRLLQDKCLKALVSLVEKEDVPGLRDHMAFHLGALKGTLPTPEQQAVVDKAFEAFAPTKPPYDEWFANGNKTLNITCHTGGEFYDSEIRRWKGEGFKVTTEGSWNSPTILEKTITNRDGIETVVVLKMSKETSGTFEQMDDPNTHVVAYSGHSGWGKNIPGELKRGPDAEGPRKLMLIHQCCGQGIINKIRDKYPETDLVTTRYSSVEPEDFFAFKTLINGIANRKSWDDMHSDIAKGNYSQNSNNNYITPADEYTRMKSRDRDKDGQADLLDRLFDFNTFDVPGDTANAFVGHEPTRRDQVLGGERLHNVVQFVNVTAGFSHYLDEHEKGNPFLSGGYFSPTPGSPDENQMFKITKKTVDIAATGASIIHHHERGGAKTQEVFEVKLNENFAHASEEAQKAGLFMAVARQLGDGDTKADRMLQGLMLVAHALNTDSEFGREQLIFDEVKKRLGLPDAIRYSDAQTYLNADSHVYAGSNAGLEKWKTALGADVLEQLEEIEVEG